MATSYQLIFDKFIKKIKNDDQFFNYKNLSEEDIEQMINDHLNGLLNLSIDRIYEYGLPDVDLYDKNDELQQFNIDLVVQEISLLSDIMYLCYLEEDKNKLKVFCTFFRSSELNTFSPSNERKSFLDMVKDIELDVINSISNYLSRDRLTWQFKSIYRSSESS